MVRAIKGGSILSKIADKLKECGAGAIPNTGLFSPQFYVKFDTKSQTVEQEELSSQWQLKAGLVTLRGGRPLSADPTPMQRSGGRKTHLERRIKKLKHYESRHKDPEPGMKKWGKK